MADQPWYFTVAIGGGPTIIGIAVTYWIARTKQRTDDKIADKASKSAEQLRLDGRLDMIIDSMQAEINRLNAEAVDFRTERAQMRKDLREAESSLYKWKAIARSWEKKAHELWHAWANQAQINNNALRRNGLPELSSPDFKLPKLEEIPYDSI
jgi:chromosome segregation ATPase